MILTNYDYVPLIRKYRKINSINFDDIRDREIHEALMKFKRQKKRYDDRYNFRSEVIKRVISFTLKILTILFFLFTPIGQEATIKIGVKIVRDGGDFIVNTINKQMEKQGVFDYSKSFLTRMVTSLVVVFFPTLLIFLLLFMIAGVIGAWRNAKKKDFIDWIDEKIEDKEWHKKQIDIN